MKHKISAKKLSDALFEISKENNLLDEVNKSVLEFDRILKINRDLKSFMPVSYTHLTLPTTPYV